MPRLLLEVASIGVEKVAGSLRKARDAAIGFVQAEGMLAEDRVRNQFRAQADTVEQFRQSLVRLQQQARSLGVGGEVGTASAAFAQFQTRMSGARLSSEELAAQSERLQGIFLRSEQRIQSTATSLGRLDSATRRTGDAARRAGQQTLGFSTRMRNLGSAAVFAVGPLSGVGARVTAFTAIMGRSNALFAVFLASLAAGIVGFVQTIRAGRRMEDQLAGIEGVLIATGKAAQFSAVQVREIAEAIVSITPGGAIDDLNKASTALLTFGGVGRKELKRLLLLSSDLAAVGFQSVERAALTLGAAMESPRAVIERLNRIVPIFTGALGDTIRELEEAGRTAEAANLLLKALEDRVGGVAERMNVGLTAAVGELSQSLRNLSEELSGTTGTLEFSTTVVGALAGVVNLLKENIEATTLVIVGLATAATAFGVIGFARFLKLAVGGAAGFAAIIGAVAVAVLAASIKLEQLGRINVAVARSTGALADEVDRLTEALGRNAAGSKEAAVAEIARLEGLIEGKRFIIEQNKAIIAAAKTNESFALSVARSISDLLAAIPGAGALIDPSQIAQGEELILAQAEGLRVVEALLARLKLGYEKALEAGEKGAGKVSKEFEKARDAIEDIVREHGRMQQVFLAARISDIAKRDVEALHQVADVLEELKPKEIQALADEFGFAGGSVDALREKLALFIVQTLKLSDATDAAEDFRDEVGEINKELTLLSFPEHERAIQGQVAAFTALARVAHISDDALSKVEVTLRKIQLLQFIEDVGTAADRVRSELDKIADFRAFARIAFEGEELLTVLEKLAIAEKKLNDELDDLNPILRSFKDVFDDLGRGIADALFVAEDALEALRDTARKVIEDIIQEIFRLTITEPLKAVIAPLIKGAAAFAGGLLGVPGAQFGGQFQVAGTGAADSKLAVLRVSPGELITVNRRDERQKQERKQRPTGGLSVTLNINGVEDFDSFRRSESRIMDTAHRAGQVIAARNSNR